MVYLGLAILSSAMVSVMMRLGESKVKNNMGMFVMNYLFCAGLSRVFMGRQSLFTESEGLLAAVLLGLLSGVLYLATFMLLQHNIKKNGVVMSATFMKLGVLIPTIMAIIVFGESPKAVQVIGILLAIAAIIIIHFDKEESGSGTAKYKFLLVILLLSSGFTDSMANIYDKLGSAELKDHYLLYTFVAAALCAFVLWIVRKQKISGWDVLFGILIGIPNYFSARFLLLSLETVPAVVVYPVYSVLTIVFISVVGVLFFKEKLSKKKLLAILTIFASLVLLNL